MKQIQRNKMHNNYERFTDAVVDCWWLKGNMSCYAKPSVTYEASVSRIFYIIFHNVSSTVAGTYACQMANYDAKFITTCQLEIVNGKLISIF